MSLVLQSRGLEVTTRSRGTVDVTAEVQAFVNASGVRAGLCTVFIHHTSASLLISENADPDVHEDLERFMERLVPDGDEIFRHDDEGPDDMPAHIRTVLTQNNLTIPVTQGHCALGIWQGIYLWEHRQMSHHRNITVTVHGDTADSR